jgi:uncharacterized phiE125 gp8 family phage protein
MLSLHLITGPAAEPIDLAEAQEHLRAEVGGSDRSLIQTYLQAAREAVEAHTGRRMMLQTWELRLDRFPSAERGDWQRPSIVIPAPPLVDVLSVRYTALNGVDTLLASSAYEVVAPSGATAESGSIWPATGTDWPDTPVDGPAAVRVRFRCGYADAASVPAALRAAMLLVLGELYEHREAAQTRRPDEIPAVRRLLDPYRVYSL